MSIRQLQIRIRKLINVVFSQRFYTDILRALYMLNKHGSELQKPLEGIKLSEFSQLAPGIHIIRKGCVTWRSLAYTSRELRSLTTNPFTPEDHPQASLDELAKVSYNLRINPEISALSLFIMAMISFASSEQFN